MELKGVVVEYLKGSKKALCLVDLFNILFVKNLIPREDRAVLEMGQLREICANLVNEGVLIEKGAGKFAYNADYKGETTEKTTEKTAENATKTESPLQIAPPPEGPNPLDMMWEYAEHKTNKKLEAAEVFNFYAEGNNRNELAKIMDDFIDYFKIEKDEKNLAKWEHQFNNALLIQGVISKWD